MTAPPSAASPDVPQPAPPTAQQRRGMRIAIINQCFFAMAWLTLTNGILLLYLKKLGIPDERVLAYLALPTLVDAMLRLPAAYLGDRLGKRRLGVIGSLFDLGGFVIIACAAWFTGLAAEVWAVVGLVCYGVGNGLVASTWFALLSALVPEHTRGRFFGALRVAWQSVGILFAWISAAVLQDDSPLSVFQIVAWLLVLSLIVRVILYARIPELEQPQPDRKPFFRTLLEVVRAGDYMNFCVYVFLISLFTGGAPWLLGLLFKSVLNLGDNAVVWLGSLFAVGQVFGFHFGGRLVDRFGAKPVFMVCHVAYAVTLGLVVCRDVAPGWAMVVVGGATFGYGVVRASASIAISTEMLALIPAENKSLSTSFMSVLQVGGIALSGLISAAVFKLGMLQPTWTLMGLTLSQYDAVLLVFAVMILLLTVTLGLVPSVLGKSRWAPRVTE